MVFLNRIFTGQQGSADWLEWRKEGVGASESAILANCSKYGTVDSLIMDKMSLSEHKDNGGMFWGRAREPELRKNVLSRYKFDAEPVCLSHPELTFMRASYDLISKDFKWACEIKTVNPKIFKALQEGTLPPDHYWQVHHQYAVTPELEELIYYAVNRKDGIDREITMSIKKDERMIAACIENAEKFMKRLNEARESYGKF